MKTVARVLGAALAFLAGCGDPDEGSTRTEVRGTLVAGRDPFEDGVLATWEISMPASEWDALVAEADEDAPWRRCTVSWRGETYPDCGIRAAGGRSLIPGNAKPSFRIKFDEFLPDREFHGLSSLKFDSIYHDASMMKARLQYPAYRERGVPSPRYAHARVVVNGALKGLYGVEERIKKEFLRRHFGSPVGQVYVWEGSEVMYDLLWPGPEPIENFVPVMWEAEDPDFPSGAEAVRELCDRLHNDIARLPEIFDVESFLNFIAVETLLGEGDNYVARIEGTKSANIRMYRAPATGRFLLLPWDCDQGFWRPQSGITEPFQNRVLTRRLILENPANLARYKRILRELIDGPCSTARMHARVDEVAAQIRDAVREDPLRPYSVEEHEYRVRSIKSYIASRNASFLAQLDAP